MQQHEANILPTAPPPPPHDPGGEVKIQLFQNKVMMHIKFKRITDATSWKQIFSPILPPPLPPLPTLRVGSIGQNSTFSEHSHVAYQNKGNRQCSNMVANILSGVPNHPRSRGWGQKVKILILQNMVMLNVKFKFNGTTNAATW